MLWTKTSVGYDTANDKVLIFYIDAANSDYPTAIVGTVGATTMSYGTAVVVQSAGASVALAQAYDSDAQKFGLFYLASSEGKAAVATVSGTSVSATVRSYAFESGAIKKVSAVYHQPANKIIVAYSDDVDGDKGKIALPRISGTDMLDPDGTMPSSGGAGSPIQFESGQITLAIGTAYDSVNKKVVIAYSDDDNGKNGTSIVFIPAYNDNNLTSENYIGMSRGVAVQTGSAASAGSPVVFESAEIDRTQTVFDSQNNKIIITFRDAGNSYYGTAIVGTVDNSDNSISFGTPVVVESATLGFFGTLSFDSSNNKVVVPYEIGSQGKVKIGTVSGTDISFGSAVNISDPGTSITTVF